MGTAEAFRSVLAKVAALPATQNPYLYSSRMLDTMVYPQIHPAVFGFLVFFAVIHAMIIVCCMSVIIIPFRSGKESRKKNLWLYHRRYVKEYHTPYYLPNSSMGVAITQLCTSAFFITFIFLAYHSYHSPSFQRSCYLLIWYGFSYLPGYIGLYVTAWNACLTCLTFRGRDGRAQALCRYIPPKVLNVVALTIPLAVTIFSALTCTLVGAAIRDFNGTYETLQANLNQASESWESEASEVNLDVLIKNLKSFRHALNKLARTWRYTTAGWMFWVILLVLCYALAVSSLLRLLKQCVVTSPSNCASDMSTCLAKQSTSSQRGGEEFMKAIEVDTIAHWTFVPAAQAHELRLKKCFDYMVCHCSFMFLAIIYDLSVAILLHHTSFHFTEAKWRSISLLASLLGSMLVAPAMILQAWRTFTERDCFQILPGSQAPVSSGISKNKPLKTRNSLRISERVSRAILGDPKVMLPPAKQICVQQVTTQWTEDPSGAHEEVEEIQIVLQDEKSPGASSEH